jgi:hypothetical protein
MCKSQHATDVKAQHERHAKRKDTELIKVIHAHLNLEPAVTPRVSNPHDYVNHMFKRT